MINSKEPHWPNNNPNPHQKNHESVPDKRVIFSFLQKEEKSSPNSSPPSFFSENGLSQDIIQVTNAEPDICLEVFYALYNTLWPQIENNSDFSIKDAWARFIGGSTIKGSLCPPEKLITEKRVRDIKNSLSNEEGENKVFQYLDQVVDSISHLKQKVASYRDQILHQKDIIESLRLIEDFYLEFRNKVKILVQAIIEKEKMNILFTSESDALEDLLEPKAIMMSDIFAHHWVYRISRNQARKLLSMDRYGNKPQNKLESNHHVVALPENTAEPLVFFKANGHPQIQPEKEFMIYSLYQHLQIPVPETALLILTDVLETSPSNFYAVQASEATIGESSLKACQDQETTFDHETFVSQVIGAFLTNPSDGLFKNFQYSKKYKGLVSIDNDEVFEPEIAGKDDKTFVKVKSVLYLSPQIDLPISQSTKTFYSTFDPHLTTLAWLKDLSKKNGDYQILFGRLAFQKTRCEYQDLPPSSQVTPLDICLQQNVKIYGESFYPQIFVSQDLLKSLTEKLQILQTTLIAKSSITTQGLFEEISPVIGKYYRKLRLEFDSLEEAEEALKGNKKNGIDYSYISSLLDSEEFSHLSNNQTEPDEDRAPEMFFQEFKDILISGESALDQFIERHSSRINKNVMNLQGTLKELRLLFQEGLINSKSIREIADFCYSLSKIVESSPDLIKEITSLLSSLPYPELKWLLTLEKYFLRPDRSVPKDLLPSSIPVVGALMKKRTFISAESESQYLFDQQGNIKKNTSLTGRSRVNYFPEKYPEFYLKQYPEWPGYEFASILFMRLLGIQHLPFHDLLIVNSKQPVLLTQKVHGDPVLRIWHNSQAFHNLDPVHTGLLIISAMLINPEDGKEDNFILSPDGRYLIPIDNDHCFLPSTFQKEGNFWNAFTVNTALQTKTILFCLDEMYMPIPLEVRQHIISLNFDGLFTKWMTELDKIENKINNLVDQDLRNQFLEHGTVMRIPFYKQFIQSMHWKAHKIQTILGVTSEITPFDLLKTVEPFAARCYQDSFKQGNDLQSRFKAATNNLYIKAAVDGSRASILNTRAMMEVINISIEDLQNDGIFQKMGPVDALELLNQLNQEYNEKAKREQEMLCELDDTSHHKKWISLFGDPPAEAALRAFLENPKEGLVLKGSKLITSSKLTELFTQAPNKGMRIRFLSLPESPLLTEKEIRILAEECPNIEYLNINGCLKLKQYITAERDWPLLVRLEAKSCLNLERFSSFSPIKILQIQSDRQIEIFIDKKTLDILTISKKESDFEFLFKKGQNLEIKSQGKIVSNKNFLSHVVRGEEEVEKYFEQNGIIIQIPLLLPENILRNFITFLDLDRKRIKAQDIQRIGLLNLINLNGLNLSCFRIEETNILEYLVQAYWPKLKHLNLSSVSISEKEIETLLQGSWPLLEILNLSRTDMTSRGVEILVAQAQWPQLKDLDLSFNDFDDKGLETLSQASWPLLETLNLKSDITRKTFSKKGILHFILDIKWSNLKEVSTNCIGGDAENLLKKNWHLLEKLDLSYGRIPQNDIEIIVKKCHWPQLKSLDLSFNDFDDKGLETLSQAKWPLLETLHLRTSNLTRRTFSKKGILHFILDIKWSDHVVVSTDCIGGDEKNLLKKNWHLLEKLDLSYGRITQNDIEIIVKKCNWPRLNHLDLSSNSISEKGIETLLQGNWSLLETLNLSKTDMTSRGVEILVAQAHWPQMKDLNLSFNDFDDKGLETLPQGNWPLLETIKLYGLKVPKKKMLHFLLTIKWPNLKEVYFNSLSEIPATNFFPEKRSMENKLDLSRSEITRNEIKVILKYCNWRYLESLALSENEILDEGIEKLASAKFPFLEDLNFCNTSITTKGIEILIKNISHWPRLKRVDVSHNPIQNKGLEAISSSFWSQGEPPIYEEFPSSGECESFEDFTVRANEHSRRFRALGSWELEYLNLEKTGITEKGIEFLVSELSQFRMMHSVGLQPKWPSLKGLDISENEIGDEGLKVLSSGNWPRLESLYLRNTKITGRGIQSMVSISKWPHLKILDLSDNQIFTEEFDVLKNEKWSQLEYLYLKNTTDSSDCFSGLLAECPWPSLKEIHFQGFDHDGMASITAYLPMISKQCPNAKLIIS